MNIEHITELVLQSYGWSFALTLGMVLIWGWWAVLLAPIWIVLVIGMQKVRHY